MKSNWVKLLVSAAGLAAGSLAYVKYPAPPAEAPPDRSAAAPAELAPGRIVCSGRVESVMGEIDISAQVAGRLAEVRVHEGEHVEAGAVLALLDDARQKADGEVAARDVRRARANLERLRAGTGAEELAAALAAADAVRSELRAEQMSLVRARKLTGTGAVTREDLETRTERVEQVWQQLQSLQKRYEALRRGPLDQEIEVARAELELAEARLARARVEAEYCRILAPVAGTVLKVYRDTGDLRVRLEIDEATVPFLKTGLEGEVEVRGAPGTAGRVRVETIVPAFGPKRLFSPDTSERYDGRTLNAFCSVADRRVTLYPGQRVTARLNLHAPTAAADRVPPPAKGLTAGEKESEQ